MKTKYEMLFLSNYDISGIESYLSDRSARGYHFRSWGKILCAFQRGEARRSAYRLELQKGRDMEPDEEKRELYGQFGWHYICLFGPYFQVWRSDDPDPVELHTDPVLESELYERFYRKNRWIIPAYVVLVAALLFCVWLGLKVGSPYALLYQVKEGDAIRMLLVVLVEIGILWQSGRDYLQGRRLVRDLKAGRPRPHRGRMSWLSRWYGPVYLALLILVLLSNVLSLWRIGARETVNLVDYTGPYPAVTLAEVEGNPRLERKEGAVMPNGVDYGNYIYWSSSDLAPVQIEMRERGVVAGEQWRDDSGGYAPSLRVEYYELRFSLLAAPFMEELQGDALEFYRFDTISTTELMDTAFDQAYLVRSGEESQYLFARLGRRVLMVSYYGYGNLEEQTDVIARRLADYTKR